MIADRWFRAFTEFDGLHPGGFPCRGLKFIFKSPVSTCFTTRAGALTSLMFSGGATRSRTGLDGFAIRCITALLSRLESSGKAFGFACKKGKRLLPFLRSTGAGKESRTLDLNLGKVALYQLSYSRISERN